MSFDLEDKDKFLKIILKDSRLDAKTSIMFRDKMIELINSNNPNLLFDFSNVKFLDSSGLGSLVSIMKTIGRNGKLAIYGVSQTVMITFTRTRMDKIFNIFDDYNKSEDFFE